MTIETLECAGDVFDFCSLDPLLAAASRSCRQYICVATGKRFNTAVMLEGYRPGRVVRKGLRYVPVYSIDGAFWPVKKRSHDDKL
jgi:hypothetical protein